MNCVGRAKRVSNRARKLSANVKNCGEAEISYSEGSRVC